ncbi:LysR family transcriptional regulator [Methylocapsa palsarum]|uniref:DNA-binding transcriptional regulator, LysR family n=1 Tax=Methylocapsa palsarum TaxID=1612308 RepID=A0A1I3WWS6_9HYPH|nr:LysR family transcriptional regulator [Methylocapsa palsarum]SFK10841.1 DNA-binding transcriptional regulator, LysR family [Methylocapsa palsarum]
MELYQIRHFVAVVETGSFTRGAQRAAVSQPAISASIARLESEFDVKLLDRRHSSVAPTPAGMRLLESAKAILFECNAVKADLQALGAPSLLRVGVLQSLSSWQISKLMSAYRRTNPTVEIEVTDGSCDVLIRLLQEQRLDTLLTILDDQAEKFGNRVLFTEPYVLAVPKDHRFGQRQSVHLADLHDEPFIVRSKCDFYQDATDALNARGIRIRVVYRTDQDDRAFALVAAGLGVAFIPGHFDVPAVKQVPVSDLGLERTIGLLWISEQANENLYEFSRFAESHSWRL